MNLDKLHDEIYECPRSLTCRPGRGVLYPATTQGRIGPRGIDILLLGWNPRHAQLKHDGLPDPHTFRSDAQNALAELAKSDSPEARDWRAILPLDVGLDSERVARTYLWKWPTRVKTSEGESAFYAGRCIKNHFEKELQLLRPRVLVTFHTQSAAHVAERARAAGVDVRPRHPAVRSREALGWAPTNEALGFPCGFVFLQDAPQEGYDTNTRVWAKKAVDHILANPPPS